MSLLGALFGGLISGFLIKHGRRRTIIWTSIPLAASWIVTVFATCVEMIYVTAFSAGFCSSIIQLATQVYLSEIAHPSIRASLCSAAKVFSQIGLLASFAMGAWLDWRQLAMVCAGAPFMLLIAAHYVPETPSYLLYNNQNSKAEKSLRWLRGTETDITNELSTIHSNIKQSLDRGSDCKKVVLPRLFKPLGICCGMMLFLRYDYRRHQSSFHDLFNLRFFFFSDFPVFLGSTFTL